MAFLLVLTQIITCGMVSLAAPSAGEEDEAVYYEQIFDENSDISGWKKSSGNGEVTLTDGKLSVQHMVKDGDVSKTIVYDENSPEINDGFIETEVIPQQVNRNAVVFRYQSADRYVGIGYDQWTGWQWFVGDSWGSLNISSPGMEIGVPVKVRAEFEGAHLKLYLNDELKYDNEIGAIDIGAGRIGVREWGGGNGPDAGHLYFSYFKTGELIKSGIAPNNVKVSQEDWGKEDVDVTLNLGKKDSLDRIENNGTVLAEGTDYTVDETEVTIKKEYLESLPNDIDAVLDFFFALGSSDQLTIAPQVPYEEVEYVNDFSNGLEGLKQVSGNGTMEMDGDALRIKGQAVIIDENSPEMKNGEVEFIFEPMNDDSRMGLAFRASEDQWSAFQCVNTRTSWGFAGWNIKNSSGVDKRVWSDSVIPYSGRQYKVKIRFVDDVYTMWVDGQEATTFTASELAQISGKAGFAMLGQDSSDVKISSFVYRSVVPIETGSESGKTLSLTSENMTVTMDASFPRVLEYDYNGKKMYGQIEPKYYVMVNGVNYPASASVTDSSDTTIIYRVEAAGAKVLFDMSYTIDGSSLTSEITNIDESSTRVYTLGFPENCMISVKSGQPGAELNAAVPWKAVNGDAVEDVNDRTYDLSSAIDTENYQYANIVIFNTDELAASLDNNIDNNLQEFEYQSFTASDGTVYTGAWTTEYTWRGWNYGDEDETFADPLSTTVVLTEDANEDQLIDWQDGAVALNSVREMMPGAEELADSFVHIAMNFASGAQHPFLRIADKMKQFYLYSDGFGQMVEIKGYNSEGHDSGHPESSDVNVRAGGAEDFETLCEEMLQYGAYVGPHVNISNAFPEATPWAEYSSTGPHAWSGWLDNGCDLKRELYIQNGEMDRQLDSLAEQVPDIGLVYLDTYNDYRYSTYRIAQNFLSHGWAVWNENQAALDKYCSWVHWPGVSSSIHRFVHHQDKDVYGYDNLLRGGYSRSSGDSFMGWQNGRNLNSIIQQFYTEQLPYRYLMNHELLKKTDTEATFENGVISKYENGKSNIYKDGKLIASDKLIFIPWSPEDEDKIYHWNPSGGKTTWELPDSWSNVETVKLYLMTDTGKTDEQTIEVIDGRVTLDVEANTPYVVYKGEESTAPVVEVKEWTTGSPVKDASFASHTFNDWSKAPEDAENVTVEKNSEGKTYLNIAGTEEGAVVQTMEGLDPGQKYVASVWAEVSGGKTAYIDVELPNGETVSNYMEITPITNNICNSDKTNTKFLRMSVEFTMPEDIGDAVIMLRGTGGDGDAYARFTDVRVTETDAPDKEEGYILQEDFENVPEGYSVFFPTSYTEYVHLSETNEGYTTDTIDGHYSLKCKGSSMRTIPATLRFEPDTGYSINFESTGGGRIKVVSDVTGTVLADQVIVAGVNTCSFVTDNATDYYVLLESPQIIDNFNVKEEAIDKEVLRTLLEEAKSTDTSGYTEESVNELSEAIEKAEKLLETEVDETELKDMYHELRAAIDGLTVLWDGYGRIEFESADSFLKEKSPDDGYTLGTEDADGGQVINYTFDGAWVQFDAVKFGNRVPEKVTVRYSGTNQCFSDSRVEIRLNDKDGELIAVVDTPATGGWSTYTSATAEIDAAAAAKLTGTQSICLVLRGTRENGKTFAGNFNWIQFEASEVNKDGLQEQLAETEKFLGHADMYTPESLQELQAAYDAAKAVFDRADVSQEDVDNAVTALREAIDGLVLAKELSTAVLEYALSLAETADTEGVVDSVLNNFNNAKAAAEDILSRAQAGDPSLTQEMVDESWQNLIKAMQYLSFKQGDKTDLQKVIDLAKTFDLSQYLEEGQQAFIDALAAAEAVLADGDAMQDEVDQSWRDLLKAMSELRLKPNKDALKALIDEANGLGTEGADEETVTAFQNALAAAAAVFDNEQASEEEVTAAEENLKAALDQLKAQTGENTGDGGSAGGDASTGNAGSSGTTGGSGNADNGSTEKDGAASGSRTVQDNAKAARTGDTAPIAGMAAVMILAAVGIMYYGRKKERG